MNGRRDSLGMGSRFRQSADTLHNDVVDFLNCAGTVEIDACPDVLLCGKLYCRPRIQFDLLHRDSGSLFLTGFLI